MLPGNVTTPFTPVVLALFASGAGMKSSNDWRSSNATIFSMPLMSSFSRFAWCSESASSDRSNQTSPSSGSRCSRRKPRPQRALCEAHDSSSSALDAGEDRVLLEFRRPGFLVHWRHTASHHFASEDVRPDDPGRTYRSEAFLPTSCVGYFRFAVRTTFAASLKASPIARTR
jgi:hypothetical protein